jgi:choline dehydrogenase-like flavoprotein
VTKDDRWDVIIVGSGATGGTAAWKLTALGLRVLVLDAAPLSKPSEHQGSFLQNTWRALYRHVVSKRQGTQKHHPTYWATNPDFFTDDVENPYTTDPERPFRWIRGGRVGGRTLTWDAVTPRLSDYEFKAASLDGFGSDWPISHADLAPHYAELERLLGVFGSEENMPQLPDGVFAGKKAMTPGEVLFKSKIEANFADRRVLISRGIDGRRSPEKGEAYSKISSPATTLRLAAETGLLTLRPSARVARVLLDDAGNADGVELVDSQTLEHETLYAHAVVLCASTIESVRILLNSKTALHPHGLGGNSGLLGRYLMDHSAGNVYFTLPQLKDGGELYEFSGCASIMVPRYQNLGDKKESYLRGFGVWGGIQRMPVPNLLRKHRSVAFGFLCGRSEVLPHAENRVEIDGRVTDRFGIPVPRISCCWKEEDLRLAAAAREGTEEMVRAAGGVPGMVTDHFHTPFVTSFFSQVQKEWILSTPGMFVHEVGGARMGDDPANSVVDSHCALWDVPNLFATDGSCWVTSGWQNPTLTQMAITARAANRIAEVVRAR